MINKLNKIVNNQKCYNHIMKYLPMLSYTNINSLHKNNNISMETFEGKLACGPLHICYIFILENTRI